MARPQFKHEPGQLPSGEAEGILENKQKVWEQPRSHREPHRADAEDEELQGLPRAEWKWIRAL